MALILFTKAFLEGTPIKVFNHGAMQRDFTYIDDFVEGVVPVLDKTATPGESYANYRGFNIGNSQPVQLLHSMVCVDWYRNYYRV